MIRLFFISTFLIMLTQSAWSENVFFCSGTHTVVVKDHELTQYKAANFKFSVNENLVTYKGDFFLEDVTLPVTFWVNENYWASANRDSATRFHNGSWGFTATNTTDDGVQVRLMSAECDKF